MRSLSNGGRPALFPKGMVSTDAIVCSEGGRVTLHGCELAGAVVPADSITGGVDTQMDPRPLSTTQQERFKEQSTNELKRFVCCAAIAGSQQIVEQEEAQPKPTGKQPGGSLADALQGTKLEDAGPVKAGFPGATQISAQIYIRA